MHKSICGLVVSSAFVLAACGGSEPSPPAAPTATAGAAPPAAVATIPAPSASPAARAPAEPTPEEKKQAVALRRLKEDQAKWQQENTTELARWTPELHSTAKALAAKTYGSGKAAIVAAMAGNHRKPGDAARDQYRHPVETLEFFGFKPTMTVLEVSPGEGWYTELLAPALAAKGKLIATTSDPSGPDDQRPTFNGKRFQAFLDKAPEIYGKVQTVTIDDKAPALGLGSVGVVGKVDLVVVMRAAHGMVNAGTLSPWLEVMRMALKPGGVLGFEEHRAKEDADPLASSKKGYVPEKWLIEQVEAAGFKLAGKSEVNANPKDTKDFPEGVWTLPPTLRLGDKDRDKYVAIGESDRMTLKFVKKTE
jgi:predicted methyltransferase